MSVDTDRLEAIGRELLIAIGDDPDRPEVRDTPRRWAKWWKEFIEHDPGTISTAFAMDQVDSVIAVTGIKVWSLCEHHLLPFSCVLSLGYIPRGQVLGLSKFARIAHNVSHRLQVQERLTEEIADLLSEMSGSKDVAVIAQGEHLCMTMRGVKTFGSMRTSVMRGAFRQEQEARNEFLMLVKE